MLDRKGDVAKRIKVSGMLPTNVAFALPGEHRIYVTEYEHAQVEIFPVECDGLRALGWAKEGWTLT